MTGPPALIVHGGAGDWGTGREAAALNGVRGAARAGGEVLADGGTALDAVVAATRVLEEDPLFNAGIGSTLNLDGDVETDAAVMCGATLRSGGVAALRGFRAPIAVARAVLEQTDHVLIAGDGASRFATMIDAERFDLHTDARRVRWRERLDALQSGGDDWLPRMRALIAAHPELNRGTVGAVAIDASGHTAATSSTGGVTLKLAGRIGDSPVPGAGLYATTSAAVTATGRGELALRTLPCLRACDRIAAGAGAQDALEATIEALRAQVGADVGLIGVDATGRVAVAHGTPDLPWASWSPGGERSAMRAPR